MRYYYSCCSRSGFIISNCKTRRRRGDLITRKRRRPCRRHCICVLDDSVGDEGERENDYGDAEDGSNQDATVTATIDPNQEQDVDEDNVGEFGDDTADLDYANVAAPIGIPVNVEEQEETQEEEEVSTSTTPRPPGDDGGGLPLEELPEVVVCVEDVFDCFYRY